MIKTYNGKELSSFQTEAIEYINKNENIVVSTYTGNGKTLVGEYAIDKCLQEGKRIIYTAPIKALSNEKFKDFCERFGAENVGLLTGDYSIRRDAPVIVATTEILRNILREGEASDSYIDFAWAVFDEIHYINDEDRGTVWEEAIIYKPKTMRIIGLSATIPNLDELCDWISFLHNEKVNRIFYPERFVSQSFAYFNRQLKECSAEALNVFRSDCFSRGKTPPSTGVYDMVKHLKEKNLFPALYFVFSRAKCEEFADLIFEKFNFLSNEEVNSVNDLILDFEEKNPIMADSITWQRLRRCIRCGVGFHHAGLLPNVRAFMEVLFKEKLCKLLFATETFAVGINFPVKTVCLNSLYKWDGQVVRSLSGSEFLQMAGRAGRRGIDKKGFVFVVDNEDDFVYYPSLQKDFSPTPVFSKFHITDNMVLNIIKGDLGDSLFSKSFAMYQYLKRMDEVSLDFDSVKRRIGEKQDQLFASSKCAVRQIECCPVFCRLTQKNSSAKCPKSKQKKCYSEVVRIQKLSKRMAKLKRKLNSETPESAFLNSFRRRKQVLCNLKYIDSKESVLRPRGEFCSRLNYSELVLTELFFEGVLHQASPEIINGIIAGLLNENPEKSSFCFKSGRNWITEKETVKLIIKHIEEEELKANEVKSYSFDTSMAEVFISLSLTGDFLQVAKDAFLHEGDLANLCRRVIDCLKQLLAAAEFDVSFKNKISECLAMLDFYILKELE